jgi:hypothetical protein
VTGDRGQGTGCRVQKSGWRTAYKHWRGETGDGDPGLSQRNAASMLNVQDAEDGRGHNDSIMRIPLFPLDTVLFPGTALPLHIFEERYREMVGECLAETKPFGVVRANGDQMAIVGCTAKIVRVVERYADGRMDILCEGMARFEIDGLDESRKFLQADVEFFEDEGARSTRPDREDCAALHFATLHLAGIECPPTHLGSERAGGVSIGGCTAVGSGVQAAVCWRAVRMRIGQRDCGISITKCCRGCTRKRM